MASGEDELIARHFAPLAGEGGLGLKDDAARLACEPGCDLVVTCDALVAGVHFFPDDPPEAIAAKALRVNLSDLAAKGARPKGFVLALALPGAGCCDDAWLSGFARGLGADVAAYDCPLLGGDTVKTPGPLMVSITAFGAVPTGRMVPRTGARPGDLLYVTGTIGDAALGLQVRLGALVAESADHLLARYLRPQPRNALGPALVDCASAAMDVSDGLVGDLTKMMRVSGASAEVEIPAIPLSPAARGVIARDPARRATALTGGDDYEILASVPPQNAAEFERRAQAAGVAVTRIGHVVRGSSAPAFRDADGRERDFGPGAYSHF